LIGALSIGGVAMIAGRRSWYASIRSTQKPGINIGAVGSGTPEDVLRGNVVVARCVQTERAGRLPVGGGADRARGVLRLRVQSRRAGRARTRR
jgi:hypothetical protein